MTFEPQDKRAVRMSYVKVDDAVIPVTDVGLRFMASESDDVVVSGRIAGRYRASTTKQSILDHLKSDQYVATALFWRDVTSECCKGDFHITDFRSYSGPHDIMSYECCVESVGAVEIY